MHVDELRSLVKVMESEVAALPAASVVRLAAAWRRLVTCLDLGPPPEERECPSCGTVGMRAATRCGHCWSKLVPLAPGQGLLPGPGVAGAFSARAP